MSFNEDGEANTQNVKEEPISGRICRHLNEYNFFNRFTNPAVLVPKPPCDKAVSFIVIVISGQSGEAFTRY